MPRRVVPVLTSLFLISLVVAALIFVPFEANSDTNVDSSVADQSLDSDSSTISTQNL